MAKKSLDWLLDNIEKTNLVDNLDENIITLIGERCKRGYDIDEASRSDWYKKTEDGLKVAKQIAEKKTFPWKDAANVKFPLIATAAIQFAARAYPQIINGTDIVKIQVVGKDLDGKKEDRAKRVSQHMSYQLLEQMPEWDADMDQLLHGLPVMGTYFKKTFFDPLYQRNRSMALTPFEVVVNMKHKGTLDTCRRITHRLFLYKNEVIERENNDLFTTGIAESFQENDETESTQELFLEQHCWYDLDGDGYEEPYIVTMHYDSGKVARIVCAFDESTVDIRGDKLIKITPVQYFTKFTFIPSPDGDFYDIGFAHLLGPINEAMSTLINQLLDSGSLANTGGGFISKGLRWNGGRLAFDLGEWKPVDTTGMSLKDSILPLPVQQPSAVLFQLLGLLNESGQKLAAVSDAMSGEMPSQNTPATTTLATIEQGLKVFTAIYKRVYRGLKEEFKKLYRLNSLYMEEEEYFRVLDGQQVAFRKDYDLNDLDISPVADPTMSSEAQRLARANALMQTYQINPTPEGKAEILLQYYDSIGVKNIDKLMPMDKIMQSMQNPPPDPEMLKLQLETHKAEDAAEINLNKSENESRESLARIQKMEAETDLIVAQTMKAIAEAEAVEPGVQLQQYKAFVDDMKRQQQHERELKKISITNEEKPNGEGSESNTNGNDGGMAPPPSDTGSIPNTEGNALPLPDPSFAGTNVEPSVG